MMAGDPADALKAAKVKWALASALILLLVSSLFLCSGDAGAEWHEADEDPSAPASEWDVDDAARPYVILGTIALCALGALAISLHTRKEKRG